MDADGTKDGYDVPLITAVRSTRRRPRHRERRCGTSQDFAPRSRRVPTPCFAASVFHFGELSIVDVKRALAAAGHPVRLPTSA